MTPFWGKSSLVHAWSFGRFEGEFSNVELSLSQHIITFELTSIGGSGGGLSAMCLAFFSRIIRPPNSNPEGSLLPRCGCIQKYPLIWGIDLDFTGHPFNCPRCRISLNYCRIRRSLCFYSLKNLMTKDCKSNVVSNIRFLSEPKL